MNWRDAGTFVITAGLSWVFKRYAQGRAATSLQEMLDAAVRTGTVPPALAKANELMKQAEFNEQLARLLAASAALAITGAVNIAKAESRGKK